MNSKGSQDWFEDHPGFKRLTPYSLGAFGRADWSPAGTAIVLSCYPGGGCNASSNVYTIHPDGSDLTQLTHETDASINDSTHGSRP